MNNQLSTRITPRCKPLLKPPMVARTFSWSLFIFMGVLPFVLASLPWQQNISASGRVIAFDPDQRQQHVQAPIDGRIYKLYVAENQPVQRGQLLFSIQDPDPNLMTRLGEQKNFAEGQRKATVERIARLTERVAAERRSKAEAIRSANNRIEVAKQSLVSAEQALLAAVEGRKLADFNYQMEKTLRLDGLTPQIMFLQAETTRLQRIADENSRSAARDAAKESVQAAMADREKIANDADAAIENTLASIQGAESELDGINQRISDLDIRIARQSTMEVHSPCDGVIYRVIANATSGGTFVKAGDHLLTITPDVIGEGKRVVEVFVEGNDAPQVAELWRQKLVRNDQSRIHARVQFEGYPAIQIIGWPNLAVGTFGGLVMSVDPHDDGKGKFRVLVEADPDDEPWPSEFSIRQGARVQSWLLLNRVSIGYELWRRFNGFPPVDADQDEEKAEKPAKVRLPK
jgi:multidrug efflux pump subunit AcrA (membrane-fusion protein)